MITIKNIEKIGGEMCLERRIWNVTEEVNKLNEPFYVFHFGFDGDGTGFGKPTEVRLSRESTPEGYHYLFVMGLEMVTGIYIKQENIRDKEALLDRITRVLQKAKHWWETEAV